MSKKITLIVLAFFASVFLVACGKSPDVTANANGTKIGDTIKIGVNMELTGAVAAYGKAEQNGIKLAVDEINKAGGVDGKKLELVTKDNKSENAEASTSSTNLAIQSNVNAIVGPATSGAVAAASLVSQKKGVPLLTLIPSITFPLKETTPATVATATLSSPWAAITWPLVLMT